MPWSREKPPIFHLGTTFNTPWSQKKKRFYFITTLTTLQVWKKWVFLFYWDVHYGNIFLHDLISTYCTHCVINLSKKFLNNILPVKNMCNLKNFLQWSLTSLLPKFWLLCQLEIANVLILKTENCHETRREKANNKRISKLFDEKDGIISKGNSCWYVIKYYGYCFS